jgi:hypothetical protein
VRGPSLFVSDLVNQLVSHADRAARKQRVLPQTRRRNPRHRRRFGRSVGGKLYPESMLDQVSEARASVREVLGFEPGEDLAMEG